MKKAILLLFLLLSLYIVDQVEAAEILQSNGIGKNVTFSEQTTKLVKYNIDSNIEIKAIKHTKYNNSDWNKMTAFKSLKARTNFVAFGYSCPGYYMTRFYADANGTNLIGWVRIYVSSQDITTKTCAVISDESKKLPDGKDVLNVSHTSDLVVESSKMIYNDTPINPDEPVIRDLDIEKYVDYDSNMNAEDVSADKACRQKAANTGLAYELKYNTNTSSYECVITSDCMYNTSSWYCKAKTFGEMNQKTAEKVYNTPAQGTVSSCTDATSASCTGTYTSNLVDYVRPEGYLQAYEPASGQIVNPDQRYEPNLPSGVDPNEILLRDNFAPGGCWNPDGSPKINNTLCEWDCDHPYIVATYGNMCPIQDDEEKPVPTDVCWLPDGTPNFSKTDCNWELYCDIDPNLQSYKDECSRLKQTEDENGDVAVVDPDPGGLDPDPGGLEDGESPPFGDDENAIPDNVGNCEISEICECIAALKPALEQIDSSVGGVGEKVAALNPLFEQIDNSVGEVGEKVAALNPVLSDIKNGIDDLGDSVNDINTKLTTTNSKLTTLNQTFDDTNSLLFTNNSRLTNVINSIKEMDSNLNPVLQQIAENTSKSSSGGFSIESNEDPNLNDLPDISNVLDQNRPTEDVDRQDRYTFDKKVFEDQGDDTEGDYGKLAPIPEPKHWNGLLPDEAMPAQKELIKDTQMQRTKENEKDAVMQQSPELKVDAMQKSPQLQVDSMQKSPEMQKQQLEQDEQYTRNHFYNQTNTNLGGGS